MFSKILQFHLLKIWNFRLISLKEYQLIKINNNNKKNNLNHLKEYYLFEQYS